MPERSLPGYGGYKTSFPQPVTKFQRSLYGYDFNDTRPIQNNRPGSNVSRKFIRNLIKDTTLNFNNSRMALS